MIPRQTIDEIRDKTRIEEIVGEYVALRTAGTGSLKGLCPFHDEKTPSFHVRPLAGRFHCFGCQEGGDVFAFIEKIEHISFTEAVEHLARKAGITIVQEERRAQDRGITRSRLVDAHVQATEFYRDALSHNKEAQKILHDRGFDDEALEMFQVGYSPDSWDGLLRYLRSKGFTEKELAATGLFSSGNRGMYDRFRGRLMWPITSITGETIGFGARIIGDGQPKYLNTPETQLYKKSQVLYGLDKAKKAIAQNKQIVVVEGYTDVMAAHLAGVTTAVATCGTAFGPDHIKIVRRLLGDTASPSAGVMLSSGKAIGGEIIFTFDGDQAGQAAARKAYTEDQSFAAQTFVAVSPGGRDPAELRLEFGDQAVRDLIASREPLFAFAIRSVLSGMRLDTAEGRVAGLRATAHMVAGIRDRVLRGEYTRQLAGWLGMDDATVRQAVRSSGGSASAEHTPAQLAPRSALKDPVARIERESLEAILQLPRYASVVGVDNLPAGTFTVPVHAAIHDALRASGGVAVFHAKLDELVAQGVAEPEAVARAGSWFIENICEQAEPEVASYVTQLAVAPLPEGRPEKLWSYVRGILMALFRLVIVRQIAQVKAELGRTDPSDPANDVLFARLMELEKQRRLYDEEVD